jgi:hypothetical protein
MKSIIRKTETRKTALFALFVVLVLAMLSLEARADGARAAAAGEQPVLLQG